MYHVPILVFFQQRHGQGRDDTPLDVQNGCCLTILRVQFHIVHTLNHNLQRISTGNVRRLPLSLIANGFDCMTCVHATQCVT